MAETNRKGKRKAIEQGDVDVKKQKYTCGRFKRLHAAFWKKALDSFLCGLTVDSTMFQYLPANVLEGLELQDLGCDPPLLLLRDEYTTALNKLTCWEKPPATAVVVTGHPGIGKTHFFIFVLLNRLSLGLPTAVQYGGDVVLFTESGPVAHKSSAGVHFPSGTWALVDSNAGGEGWYKERMGARMFVMKSITAIELRALGVHKISQLHSLDVDQLMKHFKLWGPSARTCLNLMMGNISTRAMEKDIMLAARKFAETGLPMMDDSDPSGASNVLFSIYPEDSSREEMKVKIATEYILDIVLEQLSWLDAAKQSQFFSRISGNPLLKSPLGNFYAKLTHVRLSADPTAASLTCISKKAVSIPIPVVPNVVSLSDSMDLKDATQNTMPFYWKPVSQVFTSLDAIICTKKKIFLLKSVVSPLRDLKKLGLDFIHEHIPTRFWENRKCLIVFITADEDRGIELISKTYPNLAEAETNDSTDEEDEDEDD
ncbi:hypothetical protein M413DRAFT_405274 [Hebeloma cylindrosporum]|uniref:Uncharacterized protein n=1 Tax=Hebeloma cylindrosporum TaxID=76867 RepID=A0A0C3CX61_HEBCY|nr:hypothetical protein M413DRAFT_405274 [Hebeloma cylindrosporum h7]